MAQLKTTFAGLSLSNPIIISSSGLTDSSAKIKKLEEAGAGAVVLKSVFEEQIAMQAGSMQGYGSPEANDYLGAYVRSHALNGHISLIKEAKDACGIPVIASINCYSSNEWVDFAKTLEEAGADALELNILSLQTEKDYEYGSFEQRHIDILKRIKAIVKVPVIMKLGNNLTNPVALINQLYANGADGVVLFYDAWYAQKGFIRVADTCTFCQQVYIINKFPFFYFYVWAFSPNYYFIQCIIIYLEGNCAYFRGISFFLLCLE